jgi:hypothetical protein
MVDITNGQLEVVNSIFQKVGRITSPVPRWQMALRLQVFSGYMSSLLEGKKPPEIVENLMSKRQAVYDKYGMFIGDINGMRRYRIPKDKQLEVAAEILDIELKNAEAVKAEQIYTEAVKELLSKIVSIEVEPIEYEWCGNLIDANEVLVLMKLGLIKAPNED